METPSLDPPTGVVILLDDTIEGLVRRPCIEALGVRFLNERMLEPFQMPCLPASRCPTIDQWSSMGATSSRSGRRSACAAPEAPAAGPFDL